MAAKGAAALRTRLLAALTDRPRALVDLAEVCDWLRYEGLPEVDAALDLLEPIGSNFNDHADLFGFVYEINYLRCIHCDLCVEACPTQAITESKLFEFSFTNRSDAIYTKNELLVDDEGMPRQLPWEDWRPGEDELTSGWMRATSPAGDHRYEGTVHWAGELGYGVRDPEVGQSAGDMPLEGAGEDGARG